MSSTISVITYCLLDIFHLVFKPPIDEFVASRLIEEPGGVSHNMHKRLQYYGSNVNGIEDCYKDVCKVFDADQPECDLTTQGNNDDDYCYYCCCCCCYYYYDDMTVK